MTGEQGIKTHLNIQYGEFKASKLSYKDIMVDLDSRVMKAAFYQAVSFVGDSEAWLRFAATSEFPIAVLAEAYKVCVKRKRIARLEEIDEPTMTAIKTEAATWGTNDETKTLRAVWILNFLCEFVLEKKEFILP